MSQLNETGGYKMWQVLIGVIIALGVALAFGTRSAFKRGATLPGPLPPGDESPGEDEHPEPHFKGESTMALPAEEMADEARSLGH